MFRSLAVSLRRVAQLILFVVVLFTAEFVLQVRQQLHLLSNLQVWNSVSPRSTAQKLLSHNQANELPIFFNVGPGSSGTRTFFKAACAAGLPSVHHKNYCVSKASNFDDVSDHVMVGLRAHFEILRLYQLAGRCAWTAKGNAKTNLKEGLCDVNLIEWASNMTSYAADVAHGGIVGLFDTPYPFMADVMLKAVEHVRGSPAFLAISERDPTSWAKSRIKHPIIVCKMDLDNGLANEFDFLDCLERTSKQFGKDTTLRFDEVFARMEKNAPGIEEGLEQGMKKHQEVYLPQASYNLRLFERTVTKEDITQEMVELFSPYVLGEPVPCLGKHDWDPSTDEFTEEWTGRKCTHE